MKQTLKQILVDGRKPVEAWMRTLTPQNRAKAEHQLRMASERLEEGQRIHAAKFRDLWELKWRGHAGVPHRIFFTLACCSVILLAGFIHKEQVYEPPGVYETALNRSQRLHEEGVTSVRVFPGPVDEALN